MELLKKENIFIDKKFNNNEEVIDFIGDIFYKQGYTKEEYKEGMKLKEKEFCTNIGNGVAIPHGTNDSKEYINESGIVVITIKNGILWGEEKAYLVIGIAGVDDEHIEILSNIAIKVADKSFVDTLVSTDDVDLLYNTFIN